MYVKICIMTSFYIHQSSLGKLEKKRTWTTQCREIFSLGLLSKKISEFLTSSIATKVRPSQVRRLYSDDGYN